MTEKVYKEQKLGVVGRGKRLLNSPKATNINKMEIFSKNKQITEENRLKLVELEKKFDDLEQKFKQLRGLVNRKLGYEQQIPEEPQSKDIYSGMLLPE